MQKTQETLGKYQNMVSLFGTIWPSKDRKTIQKRSFFPTHCFYTSPGICRRFRPKVLSQTPKNAVFDPRSYSKGPNHALKKVLTNETPCIDALFSWSFEPFSVLGPLCSFSGYFWEHAPRLHVLRCPRVDCNSDFLPRSSSSVSRDKMIQSSRHLLVPVIFSKVVKCWSWVHSLSPSGDSVLSGPPPLSLVIK